jgi:hypothetical protein
MCCRFAKWRLSGTWLPSDTVHFWVPSTCPFRSDCRYRSPRHHPSSFPLNWP